MDAPDKARVIPLHGKATWDAVRAEYNKMAAMGWQSVQQAAKVGAMLLALKKDCDHTGPNNFAARCKVEMPNLRASTRAYLMRFAAYLPLLEQHQPGSQRAALALLPKAPRKKKRKAKAYIEDDDERIEPDDDEPEENYVTAYWLRVDAAIRFAVYTHGPVDRDMALRARACAAAWEKLARKLERTLK